MTSRTKEELDMTVYSHHITAHTDKCYSGECATSCSQVKYVVLHVQVYGVPSLGDIVKKNFTYSRDNFTCARNIFHVHRW